MTKKAEAVPELIQVATAMEDDMQRLEASAASVAKLRLNTEKNIQRAARTLQEALQTQEQLTARLSAFGQAMARMQQRQQKAIDDLGARATEIRSQFDNLTEHMQRYAELGKQAGEVTRQLQLLPAPHGAGSPEDTAPIDLVVVQDQLAAIAEGAKLLAGSADAAGLSEVSREATALRQRVDAARARLGQATSKARVDPSN